ncbi:MAG: VOC family protein [Chloroflexi bacterium]|nr:MAG: VOC family protein [Chloroflexota bacterium]TME11321.1 MAG: VOC family protein [Chloroflexota bacterium]
MAMVHHLGWAVRSIDDSRPHFESALGLAFAGEEGFPEVRVAFFGTGAASVELLEPLSDQTDLGVFLATRGEGLHHLGLKVDDVAAALDEARTRGFRLLDTSPRSGARQTLIGYVDPERADGVLIQFVQDR